MQKQCKRCGGLNTKFDQYYGKYRRDQFYCRDCRRHFSDQTLSPDDRKECPRCYNKNTRKAGTNKGKTFYFCKDCKRNFREYLKPMYNREGDKYCDGCKSFVKIDDFPKCYGKPTGRLCKKCSYDKSALKEPNFKKYGLTREDVDNILVNQGGVCVICGIEIRNERFGGMFVDHSHINGMVRGLLCRQCNTLLGHAKESIEILQNAIDYLKKFR